MDLLAKLQEDMKTAMRSGEKERLGVIRMLISDVRNIDLDPKKPTAEQAVSAYAKKLHKAVEEYQKIGKSDEVEKLNREIAIVESYLPKKASRDDTARLVDEFLSKNAFTEKQMGQAMGAFMKAHGSQVDPAAANALLRARLSK